MNLSNAQLQAEVQRLQRLLDYYREFGPKYPELTVPPPCYFVEEGKAGWYLGRVLRGSLERSPGRFPSLEAAVAAAWDNVNIKGKPSHEDSQR